MLPFWLSSCFVNSILCSVSSLHTFLHLVLGSHINMHFVLTTRRTVFPIGLTRLLCLSVFPSADNENHNKGDSPKATSASGSQEQQWRSSQPQPQPQAQAQAQTQTQTQTQSQPQAHSLVKLQIQPQTIAPRNHTVSRECSRLHTRQWQEQESIKSD